MESLFIYSSFLLDQNNFRQER